MSKEDRKIWLINEQGQKFFIYETEKCDMEKELNETIQRLQQENEANKKRIEEIIQKLDIDIERNNRAKEVIERDFEGRYVNHIITYKPEIIKQILEELLKDRGE